MKVYHGSDTYIDVIDLAKCKPRKDFGRGFYVTNIYRQAEDMANRIAHWHNTQPAISEFDFDEFAYEDEDFKVLCFEGYTEEWFDFVMLNRNNQHQRQAHSFDIVEGPVADDTVSLRINDYLKGVISRQVFFDELKFYKKTHQICFCTDKSLQMLKRAYHEIDSIYHIDDLVVQQLMTDYGLSDMRANDLYFDSGTYSRLIDEDSKLYQTPWTEIYKLLVQELNLKK
jgi:hypothetical protein